MDTELTTEKPKWSHKTPAFIVFSTWKGYTWKGYDNTKKFICDPLLMPHFPALFDDEDAFSGCRVKVNFETHKVFDSTMTIEVTLPHHKPGSLYNDLPYKSALTYYPTNFAVRGHKLEPDIGEVDFKELVTQFKIQKPEIDTDKFIVIAVKTVSAPVQFNLNPPEMPEHVVKTLEDLKKLATADKFYIVMEDHGGLQLPFVRQSLSSRDGTSGNFASKLCPSGKADG